MFIRKRTYLDLKEQNDRLDRIASDVVAQNGRLLDAWREDIDKFKRLIDDYHILHEDYCELRCSHDALRDEYDAMVRHSQQLEQTIIEQEAIVKDYGNLVAAKDYFSAKCKYYAKLLCIEEEEALDTITTSGETEE